MTKRTMTDEQIEKAYAAVRLCKVRVDDACYTLVREMRAAGDTEEAITSCVNSVLASTACTLLAASLIPVATHEKRLDIAAAVTTIALDEAEAAIERHEESPVN